MGRPRDFDEDTAVDAAVAEFRRRGYADTSTRDLSAATGVTMSSLYRVLGDKHTLLLRCLDRYAETEAAEERRCVQGPGPAIDVLRAWLLAPLDAVGAGEGCLMVTVATELGGLDAEVTAKVATAFEGLRATARDLLARGVDDGSVRADVDVEEAGSALAALVIGLRVQARVPGSATSMRQAVDHHLETLAAAPR